MKRHIYLTLLISTWIILAGKLVYDNYFNQSAKNYVSLETGLRELPSESEWMNIFHDGRKMGHAVYSIENRGAEGYRIKSSTHLNVVFGGLESDIDMESSALMDTLFRLHSFGFQMVSDQYTTHVRGKKEGSTMTLDFIQGGDTTSTEIEVPEDLYTYTAIQPMVASKGIVQGESVRVPAYDPMSNEMSDVIISHEGKEMVSVAGDKRILNKLKIEFKGIPSIMWLDDNGITYKEETIMGMTMERTTPELAMAKSQSGEVDLLSGFAITPNQKISNPQMLSGLVLEISGIAPEILTPLNSNRQQVLSVDPITISLSKQVSEVDTKTIQNHLQASGMIQSDHSRIQQQLEKILKAQTDAKAASKTINRWVYGYLEKRPVASISGAVDILETGVGDCTEHTTLYTALSRAAGIPTKIHIGLVYLQGRFLFHAWPVVAIDGEWVDVDPSLNQYPADATHIALLEGDFKNLTDLIPVLGNIEIKVLVQEY